MAKSNPSSYTGRVTEPEKPAVATTVTENTIKYVAVQSLIDAHFVYNGQVSGQRYDWLRAGSIVSVLAEDVSDLLSKRLGAKSCCGGEDTNRIFQLAQ